MSVRLIQTSALLLSASLLSPLWAQSVSPPVIQPPPEQLREFKDPLERPARLPETLSVPKKRPDGLIGLGEIIIDRANRSFSVPGRVLRTDGPLEFVAVMQGGDKDYESMFELITNALDFNLACILIGLDEEKRATAPEYHFDLRPIDGPAVRVEALWGDKGKERSVAIEDLFLLKEGNVPEPEGGHWVYTGSVRYAEKLGAQVSGSLIGFVHSPDPLIEHRTGLGLGNYGSVGIREGVLPKENEPMRLRVSLPASRGE